MARKKELKNNGKWNDQRAQEWGWAGAGHEKWGRERNFSRYEEEAERVDL